VRSPIQTVPAPPVFAAITSSTAPSSGIAPPPAGPHAYSISRLRTRMRLPFAREVEGVPVPPPDVPAARVGQLQLQAIGRRVAVDLKADRIAIGHREREGPARDHEAASPLEIEVEAHGGAEGRSLPGDAELRQPRSDWHPCRKVVEVVENLASHASSKVSFVPLAD
jgi:hypothetical protein